MAEISIIVPMYKVEKYIERCLKSLLNQTFSDIEIIVVNDGSPDRSEEIALDMAKYDQRIKVFSKKNGGVSSARNYGLEICTGKYIMFVDSDDLIHPQMCEILYSCAEKDNSVFVRCGFASFDSDIVDFDTYNTNDIKQECILNDSVVNNLLDDTLTWSVWGAILKRDFLQENNLQFELFNELGEDVPFTLKMLSKLKTYTKVDISLYYYYNNPSSIMHSIDESLFTAYEHIMKIMTQYYKQINDTTIIEPLAIRLLSYIIFWNRASRKQAPKLTYDILEIKKIYNVLRKIEELPYFRDALITYNFIYVDKYSWINSFIKLFKTKQRVLAATIWYVNRCLLKK